MDYSFFKGKKVFITGHTGFKGGWLAFWLKELGAHVTGYALPPEYENGFFNTLNLKGLIHSIEGDVRDYEALQKSIQDAQPEIVFHLAAQALVRRSYQDPLTTYNTNVLGSVHLLESVKHCPSVRSLVYITSDKCYWNHEWVWGYRETDELGGPDPYSASKACAENVFRSYCESYFKERKHFGCGSSRAGNVIGGGDRSVDRIVPDIVKAIENRHVVKLRNPHATRPWQHVLDPLNGYLYLARRLYEDTSLSGHAWNFGPHTSAIRTVHDLAKRFIDVWGEGEVQVDEVTPKVHEATLLHLNIDKAQTLLGWQPKNNFHAAVEKTAEWYTRIQAGENPHKVTQEQLRMFIND